MYASLRNSLGALATRVKRPTTVPIFSRVFPATQGPFYLYDVHIDARTASGENKVCSLPLREQIRHKLEHWKNLRKFEKIMITTRAPCDNGDVISRHRIFSWFLFGCTDENFLSVRGTRGHSVHIFANVFGDSKTVLSVRDAHIDEDSSENKTDSYFRQRANYIYVGYKIRKMYAISRNI